MVSQELLFDYGFLNPAGKGRFGGLSIEQRKSYRKQVHIDVEQYIEEEIREIHNQLLTNRPPSRTGYPKSLRSIRLIYENYNMSIEEMYYWVFTQLTVAQAFRKDELIKITDIFAASEMSSYWGISAQRLALQQDRAAQYLKFISDMVKTMFQLIRDLNIVDEKLSYYEDSFGDDEKKAMDAEIVLKGQYADLVEGGPKNPSSIFGMAQQFNFVTLPNLFFQTRIPGKTEDEVIGQITDKIKDLPFGGDGHTFKTVLQRKLSQFYRWKFRTHDQLKTYRKLYKSYLKQHYNTIRLYMNWVKPYLRNINKLQPSGDLANSAELITAFEGEMIEIEILAHKPAGGAEACVLARFDYRTVPQLDYLPNAQERRATMVGRGEMHLKAYAWTKDEIENYQKMKEEEDFELLKQIDAGLHEALEAVQENIHGFLDEKEEDAPKKKKGLEWVEDRKGRIKPAPEKNAKRGYGAPSAGSIFEPFVQVVKGFGVFTESFARAKKPKGKKADKSTAIFLSKLNTWFTYKYYKKAHRLVAW